MVHNLTWQRATCAVALAFACLLPPAARAEVQQPSQTVSAASKSAVLARAEDVIKKVKGQVAPDERISVFDVQARQEGDVLVLTGRVLTRQQKEAVARALQPLDGIGEIHDEVAYFPYPDAGQQPYALARYPVVHLRSQPKNSAELCSEVEVGAPLRVLALQGDWARVQGVDDGYIGWASKSNLVWLDEQKFRDWTAAERVTITAHRASLFDAPADKARGIGYVMAGARLKRLGVGGGFHRLEMPTGTIVYVREQDARPAADPPDKDPQRVLATARALMGTPYLWGGASPLMMDCSGFSQLVYRLHGYQLPRDADQQQNSTRAVKAIADLKPGDLVFFDSANHMGIYLGEGQVIHCSSSKGGVVINSLDPRAKNYDTWLHKSFAGGGRVIL